MTASTGRDPPRDRDGHVGHGDVPADGRQGQDGGDHPPGGEDEDMERFEERADEMGGRSAEGRTSRGSAPDRRAGAPVAPQGRAVWPLVASSCAPEGAAGSCGDRASTGASGSSASCVRLAPSRRGRAVRAVHRVLERRGSGDAGAATAEYAIATMAAVAFAGLLVVILQSDEVRGMLLDLVRRALTYDR
jgi:hypothetical protein